MSTWRNAVQQHYHRKWGGEVTPVTITHGPVADLPPDFVVLKFAPHGDRKLWTYATAGMAQPGDKTAVELHMYTMVPDDTAILELLYAFAHYHRTDTPLSVGRSMYFGRPWLEGSTLENGLVSLPHLDGPELGQATIGGTKVQCLWLIPITAQESTLNKNLGLEALEGRFEANKLNFVDPYRKSCV